VFYLSAHSTKVSGARIETNRFPLADAGQRANLPAKVSSALMSRAAY
jgi:hypothetical protein